MERQANNAASDVNCSDDEINHDQARSSEPRVDEKCNGKRHDAITNMVMALTRVAVAYASCAYCRW